MSRFLISISIIPVLLLAACSSTPIQATISLTETPNLQTSPSKNIAVNIRNVTDSREFITSGDNPALPQLATVKEIDPTSVSTATAQVRGTSGVVVADIFTEKKISAIVKSAIEESFRRAGYRISNSVTDAIPVDVNIISFWAYNTSGGWAFRFHFDISVEMTGDLPVLQKQKRYSSNIQLSSGWQAGPRSYRNTISKGMDKFVRELASQLIK